MLEVNAIRYAGVREPGDYGGTDFAGRAWEIETTEGRCIVPESVAAAIRAVSREEVGR